MATETAKAGDIAVIETGGKQYIVAVGDVLDVELLGEHEAGAKIEFDTVLLTDDGAATKVGAPYVAGAKVTASYVEEKKGPKLSILRYQAKSNRDRKIGHRQHYARIKIEAIK
jgi:large subunit ribosomal protein L21